MFRFTLGRRRFTRLHLILWVCGLVLVTGMSVQGVIARPGTAGGDKLVHFASYLVLGYFYPRPLLGWRGYLCVWAFLTGLGGFLEFLQWGFIRAGIGDPLDALANSLGAACGLILFYSTQSGRKNGKQDI